MQSGNVLTLSRAEDAHNFWVGQRIVADNDWSGAAMRAGNSLVAAVDTESGTIKLASPYGITALSDGDFLFEYDASGMDLTDELARRVQTLESEVRRLRALVGPEAT